MASKKQLFKRLLLGGLLILLGGASPYIYTRLTWKSSAVTVHALSNKSAETLPLRIGALNIAHGRGNSPGASNWNTESKDEHLDRLNHIADFIKREELTIVVLNEVDFNCLWSHNIDQSLHIAKRANFPYIFRQTNFNAKAPFFSLHFGNAILSKFPITNPRFIEYPTLSNFENVLFGAKHGSACDIQISSEQSFTIVPIHLEVREQNVRLKALDTLTRRVNPNTLFVGDFNCIPEALLKKSSLKAAGGTAITTDLATFPSSSPKRRIDWIITPSAWKHSSFETHSTPLSDHSFIVAEIALPLE